MYCYKKFKPLFEMESGRFDTFALTGGRGSMKTGHAVRSVMVEMMKRRLRVVCFRETKTSQKDSLINEFKELIDGEFKGRGFVSNTETIKNVLTGATVTFLGLRDANDNAREAIKGLAQVDIWLVDEAQAVSAGVWDVLLKTIRKEGAKLIVIYNRIDDDFVEVNYPELEHTGLLSDKFIGYAELVKKNKPDEFERDYLNKPRGANVARVVKYWSAENVVENIRYFEEYDIYWSLDFNVNPAMSVLAHYDKKNFFVFDEIVLNNVITQDVVDEFISRYPPDKVKGVVQICGDASGKYRKTQSRYSDYAIIQNTLSRANYQTNFNLRRFNPPILNRINAFNRQVFDVEGKRHFFVHPRCRWLIYNMRKLCFKPGSSIVDAPTPAEVEEDEDKLYLGHIFDAASYMVEYFKPVVRE